MQYIFQFETAEERAQIEAENADKFLREVRCVTEGNFLIFDDEPSTVERLKSENEDLKSRVADMELAFAEMIAGGI